MKGLTHFISGAAAGTFVAGAVQGAVETDAMILVLGGVFGILPDTLDFKLAQFITRRDVEVDPDPRAPDPQAMADAVAGAAARAWEQKRAVTVQLHTVPMGSDLWRQYFVVFSPEEREVVVRLGPAVTTSQVPVEMGLPDVGAEGRAKLDAAFTYTYDGETSVDIFNGPSFTFAPSGSGESLEVEFLAWHRHWSHSLVLAAVFGLLAWLVWGWPAGLVAGLGYGVHVLEDQLGMMGSNLFWPLTGRRMKGLGLMRSSDAMPNFAFVWLAAVTLLFNLNRFRAEPVLSTDPFLFFGVAFAAPLAAIWAAGKLLRLFEGRLYRDRIMAEAVEAMDEMGDTF